MSPTSLSKQPLTLQRIHSKWTTALNLPPTSCIHSLRSLLRSIKSSSLSSTTPPASRDSCLPSTTVLHPKSLASLYLDLALTYAFLGEYHKASLCFQEAATVDVGNAFALFGLGLAKAEARDWRGAKKNWERCLRCFESKRHGRRDDITYKLYQGDHWLSTLWESSNGVPISQAEWVLRRRIVKQNYDVALIQNASRRNVGLLSEEALEQIKHHGLNGIPAGIKFGPNWNVELDSIDTNPGIGNDAKVLQAHTDCVEVPSPHMECARTWPIDIKEPAAVLQTGSSPPIPPLQISRTWPIRVESATGAQSLSKPLPSIPSLGDIKTWPDQTEKPVTQPLMESPSPISANQAAGTWQRLCRNAPGPPPTAPLPPPPILHFTQDGFKSLARLPTAPLPPISTFRNHKEPLESRTKLSSIPDVADEEETSEPFTSRTLTGLLQEYSDDSPTLGRQRSFPVRTTSLNNTAMYGEPSSSMSQHTLTPSSSSSTQRQLRKSKILLSPFVYTPFAVPDRLSFYFPRSGESLAEEEQEGEGERFDESSKRPKSMWHKGALTGGVMEGDGNATDDTEQYNEERGEGESTENHSGAIYDEEVERLGNRKASTREEDYNHDEEDLFFYEHDDHGINEASANLEPEGEILLPKTFEGFGPRRDSADWNTRYGGFPGKRFL